MASISHKLETVSSNLQLWQNWQNGDIQGRDGGKEGERKEEEGEERGSEREGERMGGKKKLRTGEAIGRKERQRFQGDGILIFYQI